MLYLKRNNISPIEQKQKNLSTEYLKQMKKTLQRQLQCLNNIIEDRSVHEDIDREKD